jgi:hypothetical protein
VIAMRPVIPVFRNFREIKIGEGNEKGEHSRFLNRSCRDGRNSPAV